MIILAIALLIAIAGLAVEIGIASWNIRRAGRYQRREAAAEHTAERAVGQQQNLAERMKSLDEYALKISWLLNFLYKRYDKFSDLEKEVAEGLKDVADDTPVEEINAKYKDLEKAMKIIRVTVKASERMGNLMESVASQVGEIMKDFRAEDDTLESKKANEEEKSPTPESAE
jgi:Lhr-like helicase